MNKCFLFAVVVCGLILSACSGGGGGGGGTAGGATPAPATGTLSVSLSDASTTDYQAVYVSVREVAVQRDGDSGWDIVSSPNKTYNLLNLVNGVREDLALATLPSGHYTQMRLILTDTPDNSLNILSRTHPFGNYFIDQAGRSQELKVPSGLQSGIKIVQGFDINANQTTELLLDFDATRSIVRAGASGNWLLKPTIKVLTTASYSIIEGTAGAPGVLVSAQVYDASAPDVEDRVTVEAATVADANGHYKLFLQPGTYTVVGYKDGNAPFFTNPKILTTTGTVFAVNFTLTTAPTGTVRGTITIPKAAPEQYATISIRQDATVSGTIEQIEIKSFNVADGGAFATGLPVGSYTAVISTFGKTTIVRTFTVSTDATTDLGALIF
jgi:hypothetical protein